MVDIEALGFTKEELQERVIDRAVKSLLEGVCFDEDGDEVSVTSDLGRKLEAAVQKRIDEAVNALADKHVLPNVVAYLETLCLQETNQWGEARGKKLTFIEYLQQRAQHYMQEQVDYEGKSKAESGGYGWSAKQSRITYLVHKHLQYSIETAMKSALQIANDAIATGIEQTVKTQLEKIVGGMKVAVNLPR